MPSSNPRPKEIRRLGRHSVEILWADDHRSCYPNAYLRLHCPCALCRERKPENVPADVHPKQMGLVGRYAVAIEWSDGHDTGIYSYETLRRLCPCPACQSEGEQGTASA
ncbi:MAG: hypothetical protein KatS3mg076_1700 [Candidatus Binatia bacterium]|nr:MAG: hypothetical protein KatS3mg076_1700 [Candidatus Binatia bacterium]